MLGRVVADLNESGVKAKSYVYAGGDILAQHGGNQLNWVHIDPVTNSVRESSANGSLVSRVEFDPLGNAAPLGDPQPPESTPDYEYAGGNTYDGASGCTMDGQPVPCGLAVLQQSLPSYNPHSS